MKRRRLNRIIALTMAFLMFFTSIGYSVDFHYCKGELKSFSLIGEATVCHQKKTSCPRHVSMHTEIEGEDSKCCSNETIIVNDLDADYDLSKCNKLTDLKVNLVSLFVATFTIFSSPKIEISTFLETLDPLPPRDIYVLLERFLI